MNLPISWLKDFVDIDNLGISLIDFADKMTMSGSKVEKIHHLGSDITGVVVGRIEEINPHPNADKLIVTRIAIGSGEFKQIVTGATNLTVGDYIPVALHGANLADGLKIKKGKIRGEESEGMLCSVEELGHTRAEYPEAPEDGIYIFSEPPKLGLGSDARIALGMLQDVAEFEITTNRPDCFSIHGLVREVAATLNYRLSIIDYQLGKPHLDRVAVEIQNDKLCSRYVAAVVENVKIEPSPQWMRARLMACGLRPVNNIVDITNYVMLEMGQPMHAFDIRAINGNKIIVRNACDGEKITTLDGVERVLDADMLVIANESRAVGIAGIMGGEGSKIVDDTTTILFESANFNGVNIRGSSKRLGLRTDSSGRYEKGLDPNLALACINRALELVEQLGCGDIVPGLVDNYPAPRQVRKLDFDPAKIADLIGIDVDRAQIAEFLGRLGIAVQGNTATIPTFRYDLEIWQDLAEEVARMYGYDKIPTVVAASSNVGGKTAQQHMEDALTETMVALGYSQMLTYAFESPKAFDKLLIPVDNPLRNAVRIINPLGEDTGIMRTNPINSVLTALATNYNRRNQQTRLFELVKVYHPSECGGLPKETEYLVVGGFGSVDFYGIKGVLETIGHTFGLEEPTIGFEPQKSLPFMHPGRTAAYKNLGYCGQIHPQVAENYEIGTSCYVAVLNFDLLRNQANMIKAYKPLPRYPQIQRDIALVVDNAITHGQLSAKIKDAGGKYLRGINLFDIYTGANLPSGTKSMAYSLTFRADDRTLTDEEATKAMDKILAATAEAFGATLRQ
ncbi:MAG: phenylalanine--tRNA ligase subunit beta [Defluviitaleaceae bacterium]|nr:phenylalanine--tRNA ligase subunit beta [Defluviitaleaceae bacterium]